MVQVHSSASFCVRARADGKHCKQWQATTPVCTPADPSAYLQLHLAGSLLVVPAGVYKAAPGGSELKTAYVYARGKWGAPIMHLPGHSKVGRAAGNKQREARQALCCGPSCAALPAVLVALPSILVAVCSASSRCSLQHDFLPPNP